MTIKFTKIPIFGMSMSRMDAIKRLTSYSNVLAEHILKIGLYGNQTGNLEHWAEEVANYLYISNAITIKPTGKKLVRQIYDDRLFGTIGDSDADVRANLYNLSVKP